MGLRIACLLSLAMLMTGTALAAPPSDPQPKKHVVTRQAAPKTRVIVEKRSFLDAGTEVLPGQRKFTDYAFPPGYSPTGVIDYTSASPVGPLLDPFAVPGHYGWMFGNW